MRGGLLPLLQYTFLAWCLVKAQGQLYLLHYEKTDLAFMLHSFL